MSDKLPSAMNLRELQLRIASVQKEAAAAKLAAKLAKRAFRAAREEKNEAKRAAKKLRQQLEELEAQLAALSAKRSKEPAAAKARSKARPQPCDPAIAVPTATSVPVVSAPVIRPEAETSEDD